MSSKPSAGSVQSDPAWSRAEGVRAIVKAFSVRGTRTLWENAHTAAAGIRVPVAVGDFLILRAVRESGGFATAVSDEAIFDAQARVAQEEGLLLCPEGAATFAAYEQALAGGQISSSERTVLFNCATGLKYPMPTVHRALDRHQPIDYAAFA